MYQAEIDLQEYTKLVATHYDEEAAGYDEVYTHPIQKAEDTVVMSILAPHVTKGQQVLDVGCGTGLPLSYLDIANYHGIDVSERMIEQAEEDHPGKQFKVGDMHDLPFADNSMDTVLSLFGPLSYSMQPEAVVAEIGRVLRPGGAAIVMPYTQRVGHGLELGGYSTANAAEIPKRFYDKSTLLGLFSGFVAVRAFGINYFGNTLQQFDVSMGNDLAQTDYEELLKHEAVCADSMPDLKYARHAMVIAVKPWSNYEKV